MTPITEDWLRDIGFRWTKLQGEKHWILWLGGAVSDKTSYSSEDLGVEVSPGIRDGKWFCWLRADYCGRYSRFVHIRHIETQDDLTTLIAALTGFPFDPANSYYGTYRKPEDAARIKADYDKRVEVQLAREWGKRVERETGAPSDKREVLRP